MKKRGILFVIIGMLLLSAAGCGKAKKPGSEQETEWAAPMGAEDGVQMYGLFLIVSMDTSEEKIRLHSCTDGREYQFSYGLDTDFMDKYGSHCSVANFAEGKAVCISRTNAAGRLIRVQLSKDVWNQEKISRFSVDTERKIFTIGDTRYSYGDDLLIFSNGKRIRWDSITNDDQLYAVGSGKKLLSVNVTTGHGTLALRNTELFEKSFLQLDNRVFAEITPDLEMDISEGTYTLSVANDGWGGSQEIVIERGKRTLVDLDQIKGEGPKYGDVTFEINIDGASVYIDGAKQDYSEPLHLKYGKHVLTIKAPGYEEWTRYLYVNSPEATIEIELEGKGSQGSSSPTASAAGSDKKDTQNQISEEVLKDYLSTLTELLNSIQR